MDRNIKTLTRIAGQCVDANDAIRTMAAGLAHLSQDDPADSALLEAAEDWAWLARQNGGSNQ